MRILLVEDEADAARMLAKGLREAGYIIDIAHDGESATFQAAITEYDGVVLDVMLPDKSGFQVCQELRGSGLDVPVLMLTARDDVESRVAGLDGGADDYLTKPFDFRELLARLRALIRRGRRPVAPTVLHVGPLTLDMRARRADRDGTAIPLTSKEYAVLEHLALHANGVVGRAELAEHLWDAPYDTMSNVIDVCIQRLRRKIDAPGTESLIVTRRGEGYMLVNRVDEPA